MSIPPFGTPIPLYYRIVADAEDRARCPIADVTHGKRILHVDREMEMRKLTETCKRKCGCQCLVVSESVYQQYWVVPRGHHPGSSI